MVLEPSHENLHQIISDKESQKTPPHLNLKNIVSHEVLGKNHKPKEEAHWFKSWLILELPNLKEWSVFYLCWWNTKGGAEVRTGWKNSARYRWESTQSSLRRFWTVWGRLWIWVLNVSLLHHLVTKPQTTRCDCVCACEEEEGEAADVILINSPGFQLRLSDTP